LESIQPSLLKACHKSLPKTFEWIASATPNGEVERCEEITIAKSGIPAAGFNIVFALGRPSSLSGVSEAIKRLYITSGTPWELITTPDTSGTLEALIEEFNLVKVEVEPGMILEPIPNLISPSPPELEIRQVSQGEELVTLLRVGMLGFGDPSGSLLEPISRGLSESALFRGGCYLGYANGVPVSTSIRFSIGPIAAIYFVATLKEFRRRGYGEAMTWRATLDGRTKDGCKCGFLQASAMGRPIYEKMGYRKIVDYEIWKPKEDSSR
jgi:ribosomal protein S18 acetylase RimI-like enzyme